MMSEQRVLPVITLLCSILFCSLALAQSQPPEQDGAQTAFPSSFILSAGGFYSDNINRSPTITNDEVVTQFGFRFAGEMQTRTISAQIDTNLQQWNFLEETFDDQLVGTLRGQIDVQLIPEVLSWAVEESFGQTQIDPQATDVLSNRQNINNFMTGPNLSIRLPGSWAVNIQGRYGENYFEIDNSDNALVTGNLALERSISRNRALSFNIATEKISYDESPPFTNFDIKSAYAQFRSRVSRGELQIDMGFNQVERNERTDDGMLLSIQYAREISPRSELTFLYDQQFSDSGELFRQFQEPGRPIDESERISVNSDPFENKRAEVRFEYSRGRSRIQLTTWGNRETFEVRSDLNRKRRGMAIEYRKDIGKRWRFLANGNFVNTKFVAQDQADDELFFRAEFSLRVGQKFSISLGYNRAEVSSTNDVADYKENQGLLRIDYSPIN